MRRLEFVVTSNHPDFAVAEKHCWEARRLFNGINALCRESHARYRDPNADVHISLEMGVEPANVFPGNLTHLEALRKTVMAHQACELPQKLAQAVARRVRAAWAGYYASSEPGRRIPGFAKTYAVAEYNKQAIGKRRLERDHQVVPSGWMHGFKLPAHISAKQVQSARVLKDPRGFKLEVLYTKEPAEVQPPGNITAGIDLGVNILAAVTFSDSQQPLLINGRPLKSINQFTNKVNAKLRSKQDTRRGGEYNQRKLDRLWDKRNRRIDHYLHSASRQLTEQLVSAGVGTVLVGWNDGFKSNINIGRVNNQNFTALPLAKFISMLEYKCAEHGIAVERVEESYTSKASFLDQDPMPVYGELAAATPKFSGRRTQRGQYRSADGTLLHADVNGSGNIIRKHAAHLLMSRGVVAAPRMVSLRGHS